MKTTAIISDKINNLSESATIKMSKLGKELAAQGINIISLSFGEPDFHTPEHIKNAAIKAMDENHTYYTAVSGYLDLRKAITKKLETENELQYEPSQVVVSTGAKQALYNAVACLINPGDEVIIPTPYWVSYSEMVKLVDGESVFIPASMDNDFKITPDQLREAITPKTKLFIFSSPCNPTGSVYSKNELAGLAKVFEENPQIYIISDEIYEHINFVGKHHSIAQFDSIKDRVVVINGFSKAYAMTGWRVGYLAANSEIAIAADKLQGQITSASCSIAQMAALAAYNGGLESVIKMKEAFARRRSLVFSLLQEIPGIKSNLPEGAFYFFPEISAFFGKKTPEGETIQSSLDLAIYLLNNAHVATVSGDAFGNDNHIRLSYAASEENLTEALQRIKESLARLS